MSQTFPIPGYDPTEVLTWLNADEARMYLDLRSPDVLVSTLHNVARLRAQLEEVKK